MPYTRRTTKKKNVVQYRRRNSNASNVKSWMQPSVDGYGKPGKLPSITVFHQSLPGPQPIVVNPVSSMDGPPNPLAPEDLKLVRDVYKQCLAHAAQSGKSLTSVQRASLLTGISAELALQQPIPAVSPPTSTSQTSPSPSMTMAELESLLRSRLSISGSKSSPNLPSSAMPTSA